MEVLSVIVLFLGVVEFVRGNTLARVSQFPLQKDSTSHGTEYRFQYFVRDEYGDYKTQEEAGEGGNARGSYAVEEPDGDLRIVQYTSNVEKGFKAHIKVDHGDKSPAKLEEIDIPADEMRKIMENNRRKSSSSSPLSNENVNEDELSNKKSKSYVLGPPKKMSDIVVEQAAAIREIISKEIEAEEKREAEELKLKNKTKNTEKSDDYLEPKINLTENIPPASKEDNNNDNKNADQSDVEILKNSKILNKNVESAVEKSGSLREIQQSPVVRVVPLSPRNIEDSTSPDDNRDLTTNDNNNNSNRESASSNGGPVRNFSFKNRIMFYKPAEKKVNQISEDLSKEKKNQQGDDDDDRSIKNISDDSNDRQEILLYSPYGDDDGKDRKSKYINVPYEILRPYLKEFEKENEKNN